MKVFVRIPVQDTVDKATVRWLLWLRDLRDPSWEFDIDLADTAGWGVANGRNEIVREFLKGDADLLWMVDSDTAPPRSLRLLEGAATHPILCGAYPGCTAKGFRWHLYKRIDDHWAPMHPRFVPRERYFEVDAAGTGCMLIDRKTLKDLPIDPFQFLRDAAGDLQGEDMLFGELVRSHGYKLVADTSYVCEHNRRVPLLHLWKAAKEEYGKK